MSHGNPPPPTPEEPRPSGWADPPRPYPRSADAPGSTSRYPAVQPQGTGFHQPPPATPTGNPSGTPSGTYTAFPAQAQPQPPAGYVPPYGAPGRAPDNFLVWAVFATVFCCFLAGIPALVAATSVNDRWAAGDQAGAYAASLRARNWTIGAVLLGVVFWTAWMVGVYVLGLRDTLGNL